MFYIPRIQFQQRGPQDARALASASAQSAIARQQAAPNHRQIKEW
jgi:hypothetical protein